MRLSVCCSFSWALLLSVALASRQQLPRTAGFSVNDALLILLKDELYDLCAAYINEPVYGATSTTTISSTATQTSTLTPSTTTTQTVSKGTAHSTTFTTITNTVSSAFGTDTEYSFDVKTKTSHTTTTIPVTTIYTQTTHAKARRALSTFPPPLPAFTSILSSACSSLLASHTSTASSTAVSTITVTQTAPTATSTLRTTVPVTTITRTSTDATTTTVRYLAYTTTTTTVTTTTTLTSTKYASTTRVPAQCAPTAYVINADEYTDAGINFADPTSQPDALTCCELCVATPNCQAWVFYTLPPFFTPPGTCSFITGTDAGTCPAADFNSGFEPICNGGIGDVFDIGLGACTSDISLTGDGCVLGQNQ